ncbi:MAG: amylo-alpha-1,6-glucosidase [Desulfovermiculus sp.]|nr:amylo-alpha-1,6-glucosidase [Desulfovermiculus sp.]
MSLDLDQHITQDLHQASQREWLETNGLGGWASSTICGANTRRYHGLLVAATRPPAGRMSLLSKLDETIVLNEQDYELGCNVYPLHRFSEFGEPAEYNSVENHLLTPVGLRSLSPADPDYHPHYTGGPLERDSSYHQGTVWAWLLGPYLRALMRIKGSEGLEQAREILSSMSIHLKESGIGSISEVFDAEWPHHPRGCIAQAWSVAELLRVWTETELKKPE